MFAMQSFSFICLIAASKQISFPSIVTRLGDYSYGIYLVHTIIIGALIALFKSHGVEMRFSGVFAIFMLCSLIGGCAFGWLEHKLHSRFIKRMFKREPVRPVAQSLNAQ
jgi:peptidoglycan/LPS O-acetylase OafA/YrhL